MVVDPTIRQKEVKTSLMQDPMQDQERFLWKRQEPPQNHLQVFHVQNRSLHQHHFHRLPAAHLRWLLRYNPPLFRIRRDDPGQGRNSRHELPQQQIRTHAIYLGSQKALPGPS